MEKIVHRDSSLKRILVTGPESTGKSELAVALALHYNGTCIPEYAREYVAALPGPYEYSDVEQIAEHQLHSYEVAKDQTDWVFFDTWLIITKVWFDVVYGRAPDWVDKKIREASFGLVLLCDTTIPWIPDPVRENGGEMREKLLGLYMEELERYHLDWKLVTGTGRDRLNRAILLIENKYTNGNS